MKKRTMVRLAHILSVAAAIVSVVGNDDMDWEGSELSTNYESYHEPSCCSHRVRHYKDHVRELSCGKLYYRTLHLDPTRNSLYVGAMDRMIRVNLYNITSTDCKEDALVLEPSNTNSCVAKGKSENYDCRNHIRVIQPIGDGSRLYVCGTNAHNPKDWVVKVEETNVLGRTVQTVSHLPRGEYVPGIGNAVAKCPFDPNDNSTAVWVENGNPGGLPALYSGTNAEFTKADSVIFRTDLYNLTTGKRDFSFKRTLKYDSKWLDKPNFVGAYDIGDYVYFFFRETAVEYINCGKNIYSRVARICKKDVGGKNILSQNWATYVKARLNCSIAGEFPFYFNEIQAVYKIPGDDSRVYAVFTTLQNGLMGSAVCSYLINDIQSAFMGKFKEQASSSSAWLPVISSRVPEPRPGMCVNDTTTLPDTVLNFIRSHPLMDEAVNHENSVPVFYKRDISFSAIVVDRVSVPAFGGDKLYTVYFVGTTDGRVYKIVNWNESRESKSELLDVFDVTTPEPIRIMEISPKHKSFYVASDNRLKQVNLVMCTRYDSCLRCVRDPYCGWDKEATSCRPYSPGLLQDVGNSSQGICEACIAKKRMVVSWGQSVHLACPVKGPEPLAQAPVVWYHFSKERGGQYPITFRPDKFIKTQEQGLVVLSVSENESGRYDCRLGPDTLCSYNITVDAHRCNAPAKTHDYQRVYTDWCNEFEKYKSAMKTWERRQTQCATKLNDSTNQNNHPNDIFARSPLV